MAGDCEKCEDRFTKVWVAMNSRISWVVFWSITVVMLGFMSGSFYYTKSVADYTRSVSDEQRKLVTKDDFRDFKSDILAEIRRHR